MAAQATAAEHPHAPLSQESSGIDPSDYEVAEQLIQHSQGRRDSGGGQDDEIADQKMSLDLAARLHEELNPASAQPELQAESRRSSSPEQNADSQYSPISVPPANGQMCR